DVRRETSPMLRLAFSQNGRAPQETPGRPWTPVRTTADRVAHGISWARGHMPLRHGKISLRTAAPLDANEKRSLSSHASGVFSGNATCTGPLGGVVMIRSNVLKATAGAGIATVVVIAGVAHLAARSDVGRVGFATALSGVGQEQSQPQPVKNVVLV